MKNEFIGVSTTKSKKDYRPIVAVGPWCADYVEIGTMYGASAVVAGRSVAGEVHCIDPFGNKQPGGMVATPEIVRHNWRWAGLYPARLHIHQQEHPPWPEAIKDRRFDMGLIDGGHGEEQAWKDWEGMSPRINLFILIHDVVKDKKFDSRYTAEIGPTNLYYAVAELPEWEPMGVIGYMGVLATEAGAKIASVIAEKYEFAAEWDIFVK